MDVETSIHQYLRTARVAQLATSRDNTPWIATVYVVADDAKNIYWLSFPERRHSKEIEDNTRVSMAIAIKLDQPVIGLQIEGIVSVVEDRATVKTMMTQYAAIYAGAGRTFYKKFIAGENHHQLYKLAPQIIKLFDEVNYPGGEAAVWRRHA